MSELIFLAGIECRLIREKRKTTVLKIENGEVIIKTSRNFSLEKLEEFVAQKKQWIIKKIDEFVEKFHKLKQILTFEKFLFNGEYVDYRLITKGRLKSFYTKTAKEQLSKRLNELSEKTNLAFSDFSLSSARKKWGSCDSKKYIRLNWRLILLSPILQDYIIIHELCHTKHLNHSKNYWDLVATYLPNYKTCKKVIKDFSPLMEYL